MNKYLAYFMEAVITFILIMGALVITVGSHELIHALEFSQYDYITQNEICLLGYSSGAVINGMENQTVIGWVKTTFDDVISEEWRGKSDGMEFRANMVGIPIMIILFIFILLYSFTRFQSIHDEYSDFTDLQKIELIHKLEKDLGIYELNQPKDI